MNWNEIRWDNFTLNVYKSNRYGLGFAMVAHTDKAATRLVNLYCNFQLGFKIENPVIIFQLSDMSPCGAPVFNKAPKTPVLYHIPKENYGQLDESVSEGAFIVSDEALKVLEGTSGLMTNIFTSLEKLHENHGLTIIGTPEILDVS